MKLSNKQQVGIGVGSLSLITLLACAGVKLFNSIKNNTVKMNCEKYPLEDIETDNLQINTEDEFTQ